MDQSLDERVRDVLLQLGDGSDAVDGIQQLADNEWALLLFESRRIDAEVDAQRGMLVLRADIGRAHDGRLAETYEALLSYNALWAQTGGARMALGGTGGDVALLMDVPIATLAWGPLENVLRNLCDVADAWAAFLAQVPGGPLQPQPDWPGQFA